MDIAIPPEMAARLATLAASMGRPASQVVLDMLTRQLEYDEWFGAQVQAGIDSIDAGRFVTHEEMKRQFAKYLGPDEDSLVG